jgi:hypothetical protein
LPRFARNDECSSASLRGVFDVAIHAFHALIFKIREQPTPGRAPESHSGKARAVFGKRSVAVYMSFPKTGSNAVQNGSHLFDLFPLTATHSQGGRLRVILARREPFFRTLPSFYKSPTPGRASESHSGKARADFGGRSVAFYMSPSKSGSNAVQKDSQASSRRNGSKSIVARSKPISKGEV